MNRWGRVLLTGSGLLLAAAMAWAATPAPSRAPSPKTLWIQIRFLERTHAVMPRSQVFQPGSRTVDPYTVDLANDLAREAILRAGGIRRVIRYPGGSLVVKENYDPNRKLDGVTAMLKLPGYDPSDRNWLMAAYSPQGRVVAYGQVASCIACHAMVRRADFVFAPPPRLLLSVAIWRAFFPKQKISPVYSRLLAQHPQAIVR